MKKTILGLMAVVTIFASCKKDKTEASLPVTKENVTGSYTIVSVTSKTAATPEKDVTNDIMEPCEKDDVIMPKVNNEMEYLDAGTKCDPDGSYSDTWSLAGDVISADSYSGKVISLTAKTMVIVQTGSSNGISFELKTTLSRK